MRIATFLLLLGLMATGAFGCDPTERPLLCLLAPDADWASIPRGAEPDACPSPPPKLAEGDAFVLLHLLPEHIATDDRLLVELRTPCGAITRTFEHVDGRVVAPLLAPAGAGCSLLVTATVANSELRAGAVPAGDCAEVATQCEPPDDEPDAGTTVD